MLIFVSQWVNRTSDFPTQLRRTFFFVNTRFDSWSMKYGGMKPGWDTVHPYSFSITGNQLWFCTFFGCTLSAFLSDSFLWDGEMISVLQLSFIILKLEYRNRLWEKGKDAALDAVLWKVLCLRSWSCIILKHAFGVNMYTKHGKGSCSCSEN